MEPLSLFDENEVMLQEAKELCNITRDAIKSIIKDFVEKRGHKSREVESVVLSTSSVIFAECRLIAAAERRKASKEKIS